MFPTARAKPFLSSNLGWIFAPLVVLGSLTNVRAAPIYWLVAFFLCKAAQRWRPRRAIEWVAICCILLAAASVFTPVDIAIRAGDEFRLSHVPVVYEAGARGHIREREAQGEREGVDFVVFHQLPDFTRARTAVLVVIPTQW